MNETDVKTIARVNTLSLIGPLLVVASVLLLVVKESPFYMDLSVVAMAGLVLAWRAKIKGYIGATLLLASTLAYEYFFGKDSLSVWEIGLSASIELSFFVTALASIELLESFRTLGASTVSELAHWQARLALAVQEQANSESQLAGFQAKLLASHDLLKVRTEESANYESLLAMAKRELSEQSQARENFEKQFFEEKRQVHLLQQNVEELQQLLAQKSQIRTEVEQLNQELVQVRERENQTRKELQQLQQEKVNWQSEIQKNSEMQKQIQQLQHEKVSMQEALSAKERENQNSSEMQQQIQQLQQERAAIQESLSKAQADCEILSQQLRVETELFLGAEGKIHELTDQLDKLTDRLKGLQSEKDELEKALDDALKPAGVTHSETDPAAIESKEVKRVNGLYQQLRLQFAEKSKILDETRRELFQAQEKLLQIDKLQQEEQIAGPHSLNALFDGHLEQLQFKLLDQEAEIAHLEELIAKLMEGKNSP